MQEGLWIVLGMLAVVTGVATVILFALGRMIHRQREEDALSMSDLQLLQESVEALIERLEEVSADAVAEMDRRQRQLQTLLNEIDDKMKSADSLHRNIPDVVRLAQEGVEETEIARRTGLNKGEIELMLELQAARK